VVGHDLPGAVEQVVSLEVAGATGKRILLRFHGGRGRFGGGEVLLRIEGPQLEPSAVDVAQPVDGEEQLRAQRLGRALRLRLEPARDLVQAFAQHHVQVRGAEGRRTIGDVNRQLIAAVGDVPHVELEEERRLAQVAADTLEGAEIFHDHAGLRWRARRRRRRALPQQDVRADRLRQRDRRRVDLLEAHRIDLR
jgi:hypothetical protein